ncbi:MAG TPA: pyridoxal-dependent decarboxylase [Gemmatimonadales bacterium]|jgi:aromatic-L-amino-acid decarboxylase
MLRADSRTADEAPRTDLAPAEFRAAMHRAADLVADYLERVGEYPVLPRVKPGDVRAQLPASPPATGEPVDALLADYQRLIEPNVTHWQHPGFFAYFGITGSGPGILGEVLAAGLNVNHMLWKSGPAPTELEETVTDWLRQMIDLPPAFKGHINDTASMSTMLGIAAARHRASKGRSRAYGLAGSAPMTVYASDQVHSSVDKACIALGIGQAHLRRVPVDENFRLKPDALSALIAQDRHTGHMPIAIVATGGTTSATAVDPMRACAEIARREELWLHADTAYAGSAAICPEFRALMDGLELADSIVVNPHKWLLTPVDCSVLFLKDPSVLREAFTLTPEYLKSAETGVTNLMDLGPQLGRRFRSLKLWFVIRSFGVEGLRAIIRSHCAMAREFAGWVEQEPGFEVCAPVPFSTVCFRATPPDNLEEQNAFNERLVNAVNAAGPVFMVQTKLGDKIVIRLAIGNARTRREHVANAWELVRKTAQTL